MEPNSVFQKALENFKDDLTAQQRREFRVTTLQDVKDEVNNIQRQHGSAKKLRGMSRMSRFLEAMQELEKVISVFLNVSEFVAFIWGPIKFFLVVASSRLEILECLLDTFTDISEAMPDLQGCSSIFQGQSEVLDVLQSCYGDIIQFYHMAFGVLGRPGAFGIRDWRRIFDSVWKTFRTKFSPVLSSLRRHRELLEQVKSTATFGAVQATSRALQETIEKSKEEMRQVLNVIEHKRKRILDKLESQGPHIDKGHRRLPEQRYPTSGDWILKDETFLKWLDPDDSSNVLLYLNGIPGAGKTTLISRIIDGMAKETTTPQRPLLNFYFEHGHIGKILMADMLRSFIEQLLQQDDAIVDDLHETVLPARASDLFSVKWLKDVVTRNILAQKKCYVVVDGLDECPFDQRKNILEWLKSIVSESKASNIVVKALVSGQRDGVTDAMLQDCACKIRLDDQRLHLRDIEIFSASVLTQIKDRFPDLEDEQEILQRLQPSCIAEASKGMFMYVKVVLDNYLSQTSIYELEQEIKRDYPRGLDEAYDRVAERVLEKTSDSRKRAALQILGLIACAARPLKWREVQCYFCIDATNGSCDPRRRKVGGPKDLCSSFVEPEACISFSNLASEARLVMVHNTAKSYLIRSGRLNMAQQHEQMSLFCFQYLTRPAFNMVNQDSKSAAITALTGFYGFFDYAAAHWDYHSLEFVREASARNPVLLTEKQLGSTLSAAWTNFVKRFHDTQELPLETSSETDAPLDIPVPQACHSGILDLKGEFCNMEGIFKDWYLARKSTEFEILAISLRQMMQQNDLSVMEDREKAVYLSFNGPFKSKCSRRACIHFSTGFESEVELSQHISWHEMAFKCPHTGCYAWLAGFPTSSMLQVHLKRAHPAIEPEELLFPIKSQGQPTTLMEACRVGDINWVRNSSVPMVTDENIITANRALHIAAEGGHFDICVHLTRQGANPYWITTHAHHSEGERDDLKCALQISVRLGDYAGFIALRSAACKDHEIAFIEDYFAFIDCFVDALESPLPQFIAGMVAWNGRRNVPLTLEDVLSRASDVTWRQDQGCRSLSFVERRVPIENLNVQKGLQTLISSEFQRYKKGGQSQESCYEQVLIAADNRGRSLLHRRCGTCPGYNVCQAVRFLLAKLRPEDTRRYDLDGVPPLFKAIQADFHITSATRDDQANIIRSFFENDSDGAKNTRNLAGHGPLEFACRYATGDTFSLVFELCGAKYSVLPFDKILACPTDRESKKIRMVLAIDCTHEKVHLVIDLDRGEVHDFVCWLTGQKTGPEALKVLQSLIPRLPQRKIEAESVNDSHTSSASPQCDNTEAEKVTISSQRARELLMRCRLKPEDLGQTQLRTLLIEFLKAWIDRFDIGHFIPAKQQSAHEITDADENCPDIHKHARFQDIDPKIFSMLRQHGGYADLSSGETQDQLLQIVRYSISASMKAGIDYPRGLKVYIWFLIQYADAEGDRHFADSLRDIWQCL